MKKYIDKSTLVGEIERRLDELYNLLPNASKVEKEMITISEACNTGKYTALESFRDYIDTLEVKEVDLEKEVDKWYNNKASKEFENVLYEDIEKCAKHFFELGLRGEEPADLKKAAIKECKSYGYYIFDTPLEVCQCLANLRDEELINIIYSGKYIVFYARTVDPFSGTSKETSIISR